MSEARRIAESFFVPSSEPPAPTADAPIIVRRKRTLAESTPEVIVAQESAPADAVRRAPKVFLLPSAETNSTDTVQEATAEQAAQQESPAEPASTATRATRPRRQRRQLHSEVTILRPNDKPTEPADAQPQHTLPFADVAAIRTELLPADSGYVQLLMQLQAAQRELELTKANETAAAIQWVRQAMLDYDLSPADLGLR